MEHAVAIGTDEGKIGRLSLLIAIQLMYWPAMVRFDETFAERSIDCQEIKSADIALQPACLSQTSGFYASRKTAVAL